MATGSLIAEHEETVVNGCAGSTWLQWIEQTSGRHITRNFACEDGVAQKSIAPHDEPECCGRVLLISYLFPPTGGSAVQRPAKLAKYLPRLGWSVEVMSAGHDRFAWYDPSLLQEVPTDCRIHRVPGFEPASVARRICCGLRLRSRDNHQISAVATPHRDRAQRVEDSIYWRLAKLTNRFGRGNGETLWIGPAVRAAIRRHHQQPFDAVISTGPPHFVHQVAKRIARKTGLPWIADVRDPLVHDYYRTSMSRTELATAQELEQVILREASMVVTTCTTLAEDFRKRYPHRSLHNVRTITNGFDRNDIRSALEANAGTFNKSEDCVFVAAGAWYGRREIRRLVEPLQAIIDRYPDWRGQVRLVIAGTIDGEQRRFWERQRPEWMKRVGYVDHNTAIRLAAEATCAMVVVPDCQTGYMTVPAKTFELLALPTHILALVPPGSETEKLVTCASASTVSPLEDGEKTAAAMESVIRAHFDGALQADRDWQAMDAYDRYQVAAGFAEVLHSACVDRSRQRGVPQ